MGDTKLISLYPRLHSISMDQGLTVGEVGQWEVIVWKLRLSWRRARFDWESLQEEDLLRYICVSIMNREVKDQQLWGGDGASAFSVKSAYAYIPSHGLGDQTSLFNQLWQAKTFPNALVIAWRILLDRIPTRSNLIGRGVMVSSFSCVFCQDPKEYSQHMFLERVVAQRAWALCFR